MTNKEVRTEWLKVLKDLKDTPVASRPVFAAVKYLHNELCARGFTHHEASQAVSSIEFDICQEFVDDNEVFEETILTYASLITEMKEAYTEISPTLFTEMLSRQKMTLKYQV